jgi:checkpoint serine/threonine-protein kinase
MAPPQDAVNGYAQLGKAMKEELVIMYTIELLNMVEAMHACGIIHGDIKPDNFLIRGSARYSPF